MEDWCLLWLCSCGWWRSCHLVVQLHLFFFKRSRSCDLRHEYRISRHAQLLAVSCCTKPRQVDRLSERKERHRNMSKRSRSTSRSPPLEPESRSRTPLSTSSTPVVELMQCTLPPHREPLSFASYEDYEVHYQQAHVNRCSQCSKNFPTGHFLNLHIGENHDPLAAARRARGEKTVRFAIDCCLSRKMCPFLNDESIR